MKPLNENISDQLYEGIERLRLIFESILADPETTPYNVEVIKREIFKGVLEYSGIDVSNLSEEEKAGVIAILRNHLAHVIVNTIQKHKIKQLDIFFGKIDPEKLN